MEFKDRNWVITGLFLMALTLVIAPIQGPVIQWGSVPILLYLRSFVWLFGSLILPGYYILKTFKIKNQVNKYTFASLTLHVSIIILGLLGYFLYLLSVSYTYTPFFILLLTVILVIADREDHPITYEDNKIDLFDKVLLFSLASILIISGLIQISQRYLISGDQWVILKAGAQIILRPDFYLNWDQEYPFFFGFILAPLSYLMGIPLVNAYVLCFPLVIINSISFCSFLKEAFDLDKKAIIASNTVYLLSGGLGGVLNCLLYSGQAGFWWISYFTQDMYHKYFFWFNIEFTYKVLALTFIYTSLSALIISNKFEGKTKLFLIMVSSLSIIYSFYIHMIDILFFIPLFITQFYNDETHGFKNTLILFGLTLANFLVIDNGLKFYYLKLLYRKIVLYLLPQLDINRVGIMALETALVFVILLFVRRQLKIKYIDIAVIKYRWIIVFILSATYVSGLFFWDPTQYPDIPLYELNYFPWHYYVTRFGFIGILSILSITYYEGQNWYKTQMAWALFIMLLGNLFWGSRVVDYLTPIIACLSGYLLVRVQSLKSNLIVKLPAFDKKYSVNLANIVKGTLTLVLILSFTSQINGAAYYIDSNPSMADEEVDVFRWVFYNTPQDAVFLVTSEYSTWLGTITMADRRVFDSSNLVTLNDVTRFQENNRMLLNNCVDYVIYDKENTYGVFSDWLISSSEQLYKNDRFTVYEIK